MDDRPSNMNFFGWIRDGVKQSVILGVSDAIDQLGTPPENGDSSPQVLAFLRQDAAANKRLTATNNTVPANSASVSRSRKRLGKSLKEIDGTTS